MVGQVVDRPDDPFQVPVVFDELVFFELPVEEQNWSSPWWSRYERKHLISLINPPVHGFRKFDKFWLD